MDLQIFAEYFTKRKGCILNHFKVFNIQKPQNGEHGIADPSLVKCLWCQQLNPKESNLVLWEGFRNLKQRSYFWK